MFKYQINVARFSHTDDYGDDCYFYLFATEWMNSFHAKKAFEDLQQKFADASYQITLIRKSETRETITTVE